ncbi:riboflavin biosynthesis protein RibD, partial [Tsukamurella tyrosinosolvens]
MSKVVVNQSITADGYAAGPDQTEDRPFGDDGGDGWGSRLHAWMFDDADENRAEIAQASGATAHIMGRNMFGPVR